MKNKVYLSSGQNGFVASLIYSKYKAIAEICNRYKPIFAALQVFSKEEILRLIYGRFWDLRNEYLKKIRETTKGSESKKDAACEQGEALFEHLMKKYGHECKPNGSYLIDHERPMIGNYEDAKYINDAIIMDENFNFTSDDDVITEKLKIFVTDADDIKRVEKMEKALATLQDLFTVASRHNFNIIFVFTPNGIEKRDDITIKDLREAIKA